MFSLSIVIELTYPLDISNFLKFFFNTSSVLEVVSPSFSR